MFYFSIHDLLKARSKELGVPESEMYTILRKSGVTKTMLNNLSATGYFPDDPEFLRAVCDFTRLSELEIALLMGKIPREYQQSYKNQIGKIAELLQKTPKQEPAEELAPYYMNENGILYNADCIQVMHQMPDESVDLIFADPPFNLNKEYDQGIQDEYPISEYLNWTYEWLDECVRILKPGGRIFVYNLPKWCTYIASYLQKYLTFWNWIAVDMKVSLPVPNRLYPAHYALISFIKGERPAVFHNQRIPLQTCRYCGGELKDYGGYKKKMNPNGVNVSDIWTDIYPVRHKNSKNRKFNELSVKLLDRIISMASKEGEIVFDPFGGSGTTYAVAQLLGRKWAGSELGNCDLIVERLSNPEQDKALLKRAYEEKNVLFPDKVKELRSKNGFWLDSDFH